LVLALAATGMPARAQPRTGGTATTTTARGEATVLVPPQGGAADIPVHATANVLLTFPTPIAPRLLTSGRDWDIKEFVDGVAVRAVSADAKDMTLALATKDGAIKVNITLRVVPPEVDALTVVRFQLATGEEAFRAAVEAEVEKRTAPLRAELAKAQQQLDAKVRTRADAMVARRLLTRLEEVKLAARERNDDNVIVHVNRAVFLGEDAYLFFDIQNRSGAAYRLAKVKVTGPRGSNHAGPASLLSTAIDAAEAGLVGVVPAGTTGQAVVVLRQVDAVLGAPVRLTVEGPAGRGRVVVAKGIVLR
jgi:hypothetical protein